MLVTASQPVTKPGFKCQFNNSLERKAMQEQRSHGDVDHVLPDIDALLIIAHRPTPTQQPRKAALHHPAPRLNSKTAPLQVSHHFDREFQKGCFVHELSAVTGCIAKQMRHPRPALFQGAQHPLCSRRVRDVGGRQILASSRPSVSTAMWRFLPLTFL